MRRLSTVIAVGTLGAALLGCGGAEEAKGAGRPGGGAPGGPGGGQPPAPVEVAAARVDTVAEIVSATGELEAQHAIELKPEVDGRLVGILVKEGQAVGQGAALFKIDDVELRAQVERARADWDLARQTLERTRELLAQRASATADLERAEAQARSARAGLELLETRLARTTVRAPFGGVVGQRFVSPGDYVTTQTRLITLQTVDPMRASVAVPERYARQVREGQPLRFTVAALPGEEFRGTVEFVDPVIDQEGRSFIVKARVPNRDRRLRPGMFVEARLAVATRPDAVVVPEDAVLPLQAGTVVWVVADGKVQRRPVELGVRTPGFVEITRGVAAGEQVVVGGAERLQEGAAVAAKVVEREAGDVGR